MADSALDAAVCAARKDQTQANRFYDLFLSAQLYVPTMDEGKPPQSRRAGENETFRPIVLMVDGKPVLPVFDSEERLTAWAKRRVGLIAMPGHALLNSMDPKVQMALNIDTPGFKLLVCDELQWLRRRLEESQPRPVDLAAGTKVLIAAPNELPPGLVPALRDCLARNQEALSARLALLTAAGEEPRLTLLLSLAPSSPTATQAILRDISAAVQAALGGRSMDIMIAGNDGLSAKIAESVPLAYQRP